MFYKSNSTGQSPVYPQSADRPLVRRTEIIAMKTTIQFTDSNGVLRRYTGNARELLANTELKSELSRSIFGLEQDDNTPMCGFNLACPFDGAKKYCGGIPPYYVKSTQFRYPYWIVWESLSKPTDELVNGQLDMFANNQLFEYAGQRSLRKHWWVSFYWCSRGVRQAVHRAKCDDSVYDVIVQIITKKTRKKPASKLIDTSNWRNPQDCVIEGGL